MFPRPNAIDRGMQRLGKNHGGYHGETINIAEVLIESEVAARARGWSAETFHEQSGFKWSALRRVAFSAAREIYISTGMHGDEPAGPLAVLRLLQENRWPAGVNITLIPCLNPTGFTLNKRENAQGVDLNRDYLHFQSAEVRSHVAWLEQQPRYDLTLCLHEDWESHGFYVYELNPENRRTLAEAIVAGVSPVCPVDQSPVIEGREARGGIIRPNLDPHSRPQWPEAFWLITHKTRLSYTLEAPSDFRLATRVDALVAGVHAALSEFIAHG